MRPTTSFKSSITFLAKLGTAIVTALAATIALPAAAPAGAEPMTVCPPNQPSNWNGQPCFPQPCVPPYAPGVPPCFMPPPQIGPNGLPVFG
ncbi:hypothetical protein [Mycobacterium sp. DL99]|uniref:hypothetical protein n=1 Tax=Mycobacterium sp. DL99 TaxID=2528957 RepID=UPI00108170F3|nr:hypothetical protein [Mycobacterium sp. DL99]